MSGAIESATSWHWTPKSTVHEPERSTHCSCRAEGVAIEISRRFPVAGVPTVEDPSDAQLEVGDPVVFTPQDWEIPQEVWVTAVHDFEREADHFGIVTHTAESDDLGFDGLR